MNVEANIPADNHPSLPDEKGPDERTLGIPFGRYPARRPAAGLCYRRSTKNAILAAILLLPLLVLVAQQKSSLVIDGPQGQARVIQVQGKNYVEVDELARITGGSLHFAGSQIILRRTMHHRTPCSRRRSDFQGNSLVRESRS